MQNQNNWYRNDNCSFEGNIIANVTSQFGLQQVIKEPTHILDNSYSCIDAIFTFLANLLIQSLVQLSLHSNFHNQLIYQKFNFDFLFCPHSYLHEERHYKNAKTEFIRHCIAMFALEKAFSNISVNEKVSNTQQHFFKHS